MKNKKTLTLDIVRKLNTHIRRVRKTNRLIIHYDKTITEYIKTH